VFIEQGQFEDGLLTFAGAGTVVEGTILARKAVVDAVTASAFTGTGDGTISASAVAAGQVVPIIGAYVLTCTEAVANGGVFKLEDPNGAIVATGLTLTVGDGGTTDFEVAGLAFTVTEGTGADFVAGDFATMTVATGSNKYVPFATDGAGGAQIPKAVLTYDVTATGAGDEVIRAGIEGIVRIDKLIIDADGDGSNITDAILDELRNYGITPRTVSELNDFDNQ
jgi:hypothetical protein